MIINRIIPIILITSALWSEIHVFNRSAGTESEISTLPGSKVLYLSAKDLAKSLSSKLFENQDRKKLVLYIAGKRVKISGNTSFIMIDDQPYQMPQVVIINIV